jgi:hypothetical protein
MIEPKEFALKLVNDFYIGIQIKNYSKAKECAIFTAHQRIQETLDVNRIKFLKQVVNEIEKL